MAYNAFSLLEDIVDENPKNVVINKKPKETIEQKKPQEFQQTLLYTSDELRDKNKKNIAKRSADVKRFNRLCKKDEEHIKRRRMWLKNEKKLLFNEDKKAFFGSRTKEGQTTWVLDQWRRIQEKELRTIEEEKGFLVMWKGLVLEEKNYILGWKNFVPKEEEDVKKMVDDRRFIESREGWIRGEEKAIDLAEKRCLERCMGWVKEEKEYIIERRRWIEDEEKRIDIEKKKLENEKKVDFGSLSIEDQTNILRQRRVVVNERRVIYEEERLVKEEEKWIKEEDKRIKEEDKRTKEEIKEVVKNIGEEKQTIEKKHQENWVSLSKEEKEKALKETLFAHQKILRPQQIKQTVPKRLFNNKFDQNIAKVKETEEKQSNVVEETKEKKDLEAINVEKRKEDEKLEETKSETSEGGKGKKKKKRVQKKIEVKSEEEIREEKRKEATMMAKTKTLQQYEEELRKKKDECEKLKCATEIRKVDMDEEFKSMTIIGKKKETINGFLSNGTKK
ncbi:hypothetical protein LIER_24598 [Lithospermum erythrorhizon]|uniref:Uncharacterized protein n=1 Tax=Lithospermum erythrorhizon TaxID=34254 RepID=A0AAV3R1W7_LITER